MASIHYIPHMLTHSITRHVGSELSMGTNGGGGFCVEKVDGRNDVCYYAFASNPAISAQLFEHKVKVTGIIKGIAWKERYEKSRPITLSSIRIERESDGAIIKQFEFQPATSSWNDRMLNTDLEISNESIKFRMRLCAFNCTPFGGGDTSHLHVAMVKLLGDDTTIFKALSLETDG